MSMSRKTSIRGRLRASDDGQPVDHQRAHRHHPNRRLIGLKPPSSQDHDLSPCPCPSASRTRPRTSPPAPTPSRQCRPNWKPEQQHRHNRQKLPRARHQVAFVGLSDTGSQHAKRHDLARQHAERNCSPSATAEITSASACTTNSGRSVEPTDSIAAISSETDLSSPAAPGGSAETVDRSHHAGDRKPFVRCCCISAVVRSDSAENEWVYSQRPAGSPDSNRGAGTASGQRSARSALSRSATDSCLDDDLDPKLATQAPTTASPLDDAGLFVVDVGPNQPHIDLGLRRSQPQSPSSRPAYPAPGQSPPQSQAAAVPPACASTSLRLEISVRSVTSKITREANPPRS